MKTEDLKMGGTYRDMLYGFEGLLTCVSKYVTGCDRVTLSRLNPEPKSDDTAIHHYCDVTCIEHVADPTKGVAAAGANSQAMQPGGPAIVPHERR